MSVTVLSPRLCYVPWLHYHGYITMVTLPSLLISSPQSNTLLRERKQALNEMAPQCPVNFLTLHFKGGELVPSPVVDEDREPWVYLSCGHVFGQHQWKGSPEESNRARTCPICRRVSYI